MLKKSILFIFCLFFLFSLFMSAQQTEVKKISPEKILTDLLQETYQSSLESLDTLMLKTEPVVEVSKSRIRIFAPVLEKIKTPVNDDMTVEVANVIMNFGKANLIRQNCESAFSLQKLINEKKEKIKSEQPNLIKLIEEVCEIDQSLALLTGTSVEGDFEKLQEWIALPKLLNEKILLLKGEISSLQAELEINNTIENETSAIIKKRKSENSENLNYEQKRNLLVLKKQFLNQCIQHNSHLIELFQKSIEQTKKGITGIQNSEFYKKALFENEKINKLLLEKKLLAEKQQVRMEKDKLEQESRKAQKELIVIQNKTSETLETPLTRETLRIAQIRVKNNQLRKEILELKQQIQVAKLEEKNDKLSSMQLVIDIENNRLSEKDLGAKKTEIEKRLENLESNIKLLDNNIDLFSNQLEINRNVTEELQLKESSIAAETKKDFVDYRKTLLESLELHNINCDLLQDKISRLVEKMQILKKNQESLEKFKKLNIVYKVLGNSRVQFRNFFIVLLGGLLLSFIVRSLIKNLIIKVFKKTKYQFDELIAASLNGPIVMAVMVTGTYAAFTMLELSKSFEFRIQQLIESLVIINATYFLMRVINIISFFLEKLVSKTETKLDDQLLPILRKTAKTLIFIGGFTILLENLGYRVTSLLTGLGIGGLAIALAAKDSLSNFFGSIMIFTDKPFVIGDWVIFTGYEGIVEDIGLRSTKVRTWKDTLVTIPNSVVAGASIENVTRWNARRVSTTLKLRMDTSPEKLDEAVKTIRQILDDRKDVNKGHYIFYNDIDEYSHNIMVYYFAATTVWREYLKVRQEVFIEILQAFQKRGICLALPAEIKADTKFGGAVEHIDGNNQ